MTTYTKEQLKQNRKLWAEALRSGKYKQGNGVLECNGRYCGLGVLCKVAQEHGIGVVLRHDGSVVGGTMWAQPDVREWVGLKHSRGHMFFEQKTTSLTRLNDDEGYTLDALANVIESEPEGLFTT